MVMMSLFLNDMEAITWLVACPNSVIGIEQVKTGELSDGFDFWLIGYLNLGGLDLVSDCNDDVFQFPMNQETFKEFFLNHWHLVIWKWYTISGSYTFWQKIMLFPVSLLFFASGHKSHLIWESSVAETVAANTRVAPRNWVVCPGAVYLLSDGVYYKNMVREACGAWGTLAGGEVQQWGLGVNYRRAEHWNSGVSAVSERVGRTLRSLQSQLLGLLQSISITFWYLN